MDESALHVLLSRLPKREGVSAEEYVYAHPPPPPSPEEELAAVRKETWRHNWRHRNRHVSPEMRKSHPSIEGFTAQDLGVGGDSEGGGGLKR
jgi:hypothetical protein